MNHLLSPVPASLAASAITVLLLTSAHIIAATSVQTGAGTGSPGSVLLLPITLRSDVPFRAAQFDLAYPAATLGSDGAVLQITGPGVSVSSRETSPGVRRILVYSSTGAPLPADLQLTIPLRIASTAQPGTASLSVTKAIFSDAAFARIGSVALTDGSVIISAGGSERFRAAVFDSTGVLQLELTGEAGRSYTIQSSTDLRTWRPLAQQTATDGFVRVADTNSVRTPYQFYRAFRTP